MIQYPLLFLPEGVKDELLIWVKDLDVKIVEHKLSSTNSVIFYDTIQFNNVEDEVVFKLKYNQWLM